ncbi:CocE/NonD family hydrolase [Mycolicibacterium sp. Y3]
MTNEALVRGNSSRYIGRIGGLAAALGIGTVLFVGADAVASAQTGPAETAAATSSSTAQTAPTPPTKPKPHAASPRHPKKPGTDPSTSPSAPSADSTSNSPATQSTSGTTPAENSTSPIEKVAATATSTGTTAATAATAATTTVSKTAATHVKSAAVPATSVTTNPITVNPTLTFNDGIIDGNANATDSRGVTLSYTVVSGPSQGGKIAFTPEGTAGSFAYLPYATVVKSGTETFRELVSETTAFDKNLENVPLLGSLVFEPILDKLYQTKGVNAALAPLIGYAVVVPYTANPSALNATGAPIAYTVKVKSFDGTLISTNFFPASHLGSGSAPTILEGPGLGSAGLTDPYSANGIPSNPGLVPGVAPLRDAGYNVVTWDPRGEFASGGTLQLDNPSFEGKDVSSIIDYVLKLPETADNQRIGMVGGSYGGGIQLVSAAIDPRIDAIVPSIAWNSLNNALYPNAAFKTSWAAILVLSLLEGAAPINPTIYGGVLTGSLFGFLTHSAQSLLTSSGPGPLVSAIKVPTLLLQGTADGLFTLQQAVTNEQLLAKDVPVKMVWFCGGHGVCLNPGNADQATLLTQDTLAWLDQYVKQDGSPADAIPTFQWYDQNGDLHSSNVFPSDPAFNGTPVTATGSGGTIPIIPIVGGAGPQTKVLNLGLDALDAALLSIATAAPAKNAINLQVSVPGGTEIVGAPQLSFTYAGLGTSRTVYAQIVDNDTGLVLGNLDTAIPVTLDGQSHTVSIALGTLQDIAYTAAAAGSILTLQLVGSATQYENLTQFGVIHVSGMTLTLPTVGAGVDSAAI